MRSSSLYRKYNDDVPQYLRNRPRRLIDDMRKKMIALENGIIAGVQMKSDGVFLVSARGTRPPHEVVFGDESTFCSCSCMSFQRTQLLCTHFCAVFRALPEWSFDRVSPLYTQSSLLTLDEDILQAGASSLNSIVASPELKLASPCPAKMLKSEKQRARLLLRNVFEMTYRISDVSLLRNLVGSLEPIHKEMEERLSAESVTHEPTSTGSSPLHMDNGRQKRKLEFKKYMLPQKRTASGDSSQLSVVEVHVIDGSDLGDVTASGPTFTV